MSASSDLARRLQVSDRTVRRAVDRELIRGRRRSANKLEITEDERRYVTRQWPLLRALVDALRTEPSVQTAVLFGSVARGDDIDGSDIDVLIELRPGVSTELEGIRLRLERAADREVQLVELDDVQGEPRLLLEILAEGRPLVDRGGRWRELQRGRAAVVDLARQRRAERAASAAEIWNALPG